MYQSPIEIITKQMRTQFEDNVFKAIQDYGIVVDKEELLKALQYDRGQYEKGYSDGLLASRDEWISVDERLPEENEYVLIWVGKVQVARIEKGITEEDRQKMANGEIEDRIEYGWSSSTGFIPLKRSRLYKGCDVQGNNRVPYCWKVNGGPMEWFGQNVTHWMPLPEPPKKGGAE